MSSVRLPPAAIRLVGIVGLAAVGWALRRVGRGVLTVPLGSIEQFDRWMQDTAPTVMAVALVRLAAFGACAYLGLVLAVLVVADAAGWRGVTRLAAGALPATVRRAVTSGARVSLAAGAVLGATNPVAATPGLPGGDPPPTTATATATATMWRLSADDAEPVGPPPTATMVLIDPGDPPPTPPPEPRERSQVPMDPAAATATPQQPPASTPVPRQQSQVPMDPAAATAALDTWVVGAGDSFWSIAETVLVEGAGRAGLQPLSDQQIGRYWDRLIAANRDRLVAPDHPDLLLPGQVLVLPPER
jgi:nucleoid-associated protein YgaU